jgi:hypothetical protein
MVNEMTNYKANNNKKHFYTQLEKQNLISRLRKLFWFNQLGNSHDLTSKSFFNFPFTKIYDTNKLVESSLWATAGRIINYLNIIITRTFTPKGKKKHSQKKFFSPFPFTRSFHFPRTMNFLLSVMCAPKMFMACLIGCNDTIIIR